MTNPPIWRVFLYLKEYFIVLKLPNPTTAMKILGLISDFYRKQPIVKIDFTCDMWNESNNINKGLELEYVNMVLYKRNKITQTSYSSSLLANLLYTKCCSPYNLFIRTLVRKIIL